MDMFDGFAVKDLKRFSLQRAIQQMAGKRPLDGIEREVSDELAKRRGVPAFGVLVPLRIPFGSMAERAERRDLTSTTGAGAVATISDPRNFIEVLSAKTVCVAAGATLITGLTGNLSLPREATAATPSWVADDAGPGSESNPVLDSVSMNMCMQSVYVNMSRQFVLQTNLSASDFICNDLARCIGVALDGVAINGSGPSSNQPLGILQNTAIQANSLGTNGGVPAWADVVGLETGVGLGNADIGSLAYVTSPQVRGILKTTPKSTAAASFVWETCDGIDYCGGTRAFTTTNVPNNLTKGSGTGLSAMIYGNFNDLVIGLWGDGVDFVVDHFSQAANGTIRIIANLGAASAVRHAASFHVFKDISTAGQPTS